MFDLACVEPFVSAPYPTPAIVWIARAPQRRSATPASLGSIVFFKNVADAAAIPAAPEGGFLFYLAGDVFMMSMPALPGEGTVWALRSYVGTITGAPGSFTFNEPEARPFTAVGATTALEFGVSSVVATPRGKI